MGRGKKKGWKQRPRDYTDNEVEEKTKIERKEYWKRERMDGGKFRT